MVEKAKELRFAVELTAAGELRDPHGAELDVPAGWSPEHLLLAALIGCSLKSLRFHAARKGLEVRSAAGSGRTLVTRREADGRYALVGAELEPRVEIEPEPEPEPEPDPEPAALTELLALAERDCFVGASLTAETSYRWTVNGRTIGS